MAYNDYQTSFSSIMPLFRSIQEIAKDITVAATASNATKKKIAQIELHIKNGDTYFRKRDYQSALTEFKTARALIYSLIHPGFDVGAYVISKDKILNSSAEIEGILLDLIVETVDAIRPPYLEPEPVLIDTGYPIPDHLKEYIVTGFHEPVVFDKDIYNVIVHGAELITGGKYQSAVALYEAALKKVDTLERKPDSIMVGAMQLNLGVACLQSGNYRKALKYAKDSTESFKSGGDRLGQAQSLHMLGVCAKLLGDKEGSKKYLTQASSLLIEVSGLSLNTNPVLTGNTIPAINLSGRTMERISARTMGNISTVNTNFEERLSEAIVTMETGSVTYRVAGRKDGYGVVAVDNEYRQRQNSKVWNIGVPAGKEVVIFQAGDNVRVAKAKIISQLYNSRVSRAQFDDLQWKVVDTSTVTFYLAHLYSFVLPVKIGDCFQELGQFTKAEEYYIQATGYSYLNKNIEATMLWTKMAQNIINWGNSLYKSEKIAEAKAQYSKLITATGTVPNSYFYTKASLSVPANAAKTIISNIIVRPLPNVNWEIAQYILTANANIQQINNGLDFYGLMLSPIHTFEYLQSVAQGFAKEAILAEREFINFKVHEEAEVATRRDLETAKAMAKAEVDASYQQYQSAKDDKEAADKAYELANKRYNDAVAERNHYASIGMDQIWAQAAAQALGGGEDAMWGEISALADQLDRGETISGPGPKLAAAQTLMAGRKTYQYELAKMDHNISQLEAAKGIANEQKQAAVHREAASEIRWQAAKKRLELVESSLEAFDNEFFTPDSWGKMANIMRDISADYLYRAIRIAKLMERAYNFENDTELKIIKNEYGIIAANYAPGRDTVLFGGDSLLYDIDSFTYYAITGKIRKSSRIKDIISMASDFPAQFEKFRQTGLLSIETDLYEFDRLHPGFYGQRLEAVEVEIVGILPEGGVNGTLTAGGVTRYRVNKFTNATTPADEKRVHQVDTMALSDFVLRSDIFLYGTETGVRGLFQGLGIGSTWQLHLPKRSNNFDFRRIFDVRLVFYYTAKFDPLLKTKILSLPLRNGELAMLKNYGMRYDFPDAWYAFYRTGTVDFTLDRVKLPFNQQNFKINSVLFRVTTKTGVSGQNIKLRIKGPIGNTIDLTTDVNGMVSIKEGTDPASLRMKSPLGKWSVQVVDGLSLLEEGALKFDRVYNIQMGLEYFFEYVPEEVV